jgi:hypothetical protein
LLLLVAFAFFVAFFATFFATFFALDVWGTLRGKPVEFFPGQHADRVGVHAGSEVLRVVTERYGDHLEAVVGDVGRFERFEDKGRVKLQLKRRRPVQRVREPLLVGVAAEAGLEIGHHGIALRHGSYQGNGRSRMCRRCPCR